MISPWKICSNKHCFIWKKTFLVRERGRGGRRKGKPVSARAGWLSRYDMQGAGLSSADAWTQNEEEWSYQESAEPWESSSNLKYLPLPWHSKLHTTISSTKKSMKISPSTKAVSNAPSTVKEKGREFTLSCSTRHSEDQWTDNDEGVTMIIMLTLLHSDTQQRHSQPPMGRALQ